MQRYLSATLLLRRPWPLDMDRVATALSRRFPTIGTVDALPGQSARDGGVLTIDHAQVVLQSVDERVEEDAYLPPLKILRTWNPMPAVRRHQAQLTISCGGRLPGMDGAFAYAAATHFVATAVAGLVRPLAILWEPAQALAEPVEFATAAETLLAGSPPLMSWISYAPVVADGYAPADATGMVTYGLRPFLGRELELAPRPGDPRSAYRCLSSIVSRILRGGVELRDGLHLVDREADLSFTVRERRYWLRRDESVFVLVAGDSVVDAWTLQPSAAPAA